MPGQVRALGIQGPKGKPDFPSGNATLESESGPPNRPWIFQSTAAAAANPELKMKNEPKVRPSHLGIVTKSSLLIIRGNDTISDA
jgi:hypothetical protein